MFPPAFDYRRVGTVEEALDLLADEDARVLAGGQSMVPELKTGRSDPGTLVDVADLEDLRGIDVADDATTLGALTTYATMADSDHLREDARVLAEAAAELGDRQVRNRGTIGGNLAQADPHGDLPAGVLAADATVVVRGTDGEREVDAGDFFLGDGGTAVGDDELIVGVRVPGTVGDADGQACEAGGGYLKKEHPATGYALVGVAAVVAVEDGNIVTARVAANGVQSRPVRLQGVEADLEGEPASDETIEAAARRAAADLDPDEIPSDPYASGEYRADVLVPYAAQAVKRAVDRATGGAASSSGGDRR